MMIEIRQISTSRSDLKKFTHFHIDLYKDNPYFVPPLVVDDIDTLSPSKNPAFDFCEADYFMAYRDGRPVGRIAAIINHQVNEASGQKAARFGFVDFIDDEEVSAALLAKVEDWARQKGMDKVIGPLSFTDLDKEGCLVEGFDQLSTMATIYNYPYYPQHFEKHGYVKESDWVEYLIAIPDGIPEKHLRIAEIVKKKFGLKVLKFTSRRKIKEEYGKALFHLINDAYKDLYQFSRLTDRQIDKYIDDYLGLLDLDLVTIITDADDRIVGVGISMPSMSRALQKSRGRFLPMGWWHLLKGLKGKNDRVDLLLVAVRPEYQAKGVSALLFVDLIPQYIRKGFKWAESNPELEGNSKVQNQWEAFNPTLHKRRRSYVKHLTTSAASPKENSGK
ncbi:MAG: N-acetyltransferase [Muribaculaceae bacterium]|nr:N-acetyltransferase [Muribaculaceae bacterium]MDE5957793.1 N-acetyltransferase [Muribaculaceae bacterium]MDE6448008.1 N-acetyltransferase [Muribaculaceae bacterium]MDE7343353.1 N-acetyltransferase [Muribaculaceae bacterium]